MREFDAHIKRCATCLEEWGVTFFRKDSDNCKICDRQKQRRNMHKQVAANKRYLERKRLNERA